MKNDLLIAKRVPLTFSLTAESIYISDEGEVTIVASELYPNSPLPKLTVEYLESLCSQFYFGNLERPHAIADIMLLNNYVRFRHYDEFYSALRQNLEEQRITIISSKLSL